MSLFDIEDRLDKELEYGVLIQKIIKENIRQNRVIVIVTGENWTPYNDSNILQRMIDPSFHLSVYPKPINYGYGNNFTINMIDLFQEKGDIVLFNHVDKIPDSQELQQWIYLIELAAKGERIVYNTEFKFDFRRRGLILVCKELPEFVKSNPTLYPAIIELKNKY